MTTRASFFQYHVGLFSRFSVKFP